MTIEVRRQTCQACGSRAVNVILVRSPGKPQSVYVRCALCETLVAAYVLRRYYQHEKDAQSYLRSNTAAMESGRQVIEELENARNEALAGFEEAMDVLRATGRGFESADENASENASDQ